MGFYDELQTFLDPVALAEDQSRSESEYRAVWERKQKVAQKTASLVAQLELLGQLTYKGTNLLHHIVGAQRLEELTLFVEATNLEKRGERILAQAKKDFLATFGKHQLSRNQRLALLEKHKESLESFFREYRIHLLRIAKPLVGSSTR